MASSVDPAARAPLGRLAPAFRAFEWGAPVLLIVGASPLLAAGMRARLATALPMWRHVELIFWAALLAGALLLCVAWRNARRPVTDALEITRRLVAMLLIIHVAAVVVLLWKYMAWIVPDTWTTRVIYLYSTFPGSLLHLYDPRNVETAPIATPLYAPAYFAIIRTAYAIFGSSETTLRALTVAAVVGIAAALRHATKRSADARSASLLAPALFLAFFPLITWSGAPTKPEYIACAFSIAALAVYLRRGAAAPTSAIPLAAVLAGAALLVKFTVMGAFAAIALHLFVRREWRACATFVVIALVMFAGTTFALDALTHGGVSFFTVRASAVSPNLGTMIAEGVLGMLPKAFIVFSLGAAYVVIARDGVRAAESVVSLALVLSVGFAVVAMGKPGSSPNYFLEPVAVGALALGLVVRHTVDQARSRGAPPVALAALLALALIQLPSQYALLARSDEDRAEEADVRARIAALATAPGQFIMTDPEYVYDVMQSGARPVAMDNLARALMVDNGMLDDRPIQSLLDGGKVPYLVLAGPLEWEANAAYGGRYYSRRLVEVGSPGTELEFAL